MLPLLITALVLFQAIAFIVMIVGVVHAPEGFEDQAGFHDTGQLDEISLGGWAEVQSHAPFVYDREITHSPF